jgi:hypothetical protein
MAARILSWVDLKTIMSLALSFEMDKQLVFSLVLGVFFAALSVIGPYLQHV